MKAQLSSGAPISFITPDSARDAGVEPGGPNAPPTRDITGLKATPIPSWIGRFDTLEVGGEQIKNARLRIADALAHGNYSTTGSAIAKEYHNLADIEFGADFLQANHIIFVPSEHVALFTYNGGPVFKLDRPEETAVAQPEHAAPLSKD